MSEASASTCDSEDKLDSHRPDHLFPLSVYVITCFFLVFHHGFGRFGGNCRILAIPAKKRIIKNIMLRVASVAVTEAHARRRAAVAVSHALKLTTTPFPRRLSTKEERQFANKLQDETLKVRDAYHGLGNLSSCDGHISTDPKYTLFHFVCVCALYLSY